ncbi:flagellin domain-containing protein [Halococcus saccharolyticus DSM 5350]|uniref:Flagellin domain-containing protein n=1 Tax=Halococcus saccharolyticus DSM 5350 TaxID=1227455 RepID=M0M9P0_9EURY|nr:flagellin domain-containing protein [Halococcus saccharolyticus DSM 5350]
MLAVVVTLAGIVGVFVVGVDGQMDDPPTATITAERETGDRYDNPKIVLTHVAGDELNARDLTIRILVDGQPLEDQPVVPAPAGMDGFVGTLSAPLQKGGDNTWSAGETTSLVVAGTNSPYPSTGSSLTINFYVDGTAIATARA